MAITTPPSPPTLASAGALVGSVLTESQSMANEAMIRGLSAIQALGDITIEIPEVVVPAFPEPAIELPDAGVAPADPGNLDPALPALPPEPVQESIPGLDVGEPPEYTLVEPLLIDIDLPDPLSVVVPVHPELPVVATPVEPDFTLPAVPTLVSLNVPAAPVFDAPVFDTADPTAPAPIDVNFVWSEVAYASDALAQLNSRLLALVEGESTALSALVEEAKWQRGCDANAMLTFRAVDDALNQSAARGFSIPGGALVRAVQQAVIEAVAKDSQSSRAIMAEQAQLEQANFQFAFSSALQLETRLIELFNQVQERALDAAKFRVSALVDLFNARVKLYQADAQAFAAKAEVFKTRLQAALVTLDVYRAELQAVKLRGDLNVQLVQQYTAQIGAVQAMVDVFKARVDAVGLTVDTNRSRTELYRADIAAYAAAASASAGQVRGYLAQIEQQQSSVEMFGYRVGAYKSRVEAYRVLTDVKLSEANVQFRQLQQFPVELHKGRIDGFAAQVGSEAARLNAVADTFNARVDGYVARERLVSKGADVSAEVAATISKLRVTEAQTLVQAGVTNIKGSQINAEIAQAALRAAGQLATQLGAAAMSARNVSASLTGSASNSAGLSASNNESASNSVGVSSNSSTSTNFSSTTGTTNSATSSFTEAQSFADNQTSSDTIDQSVSNSTTTAASNETQTATRITVSGRGTTNFSVRRQHIYRKRGD